MRSHSLNMHTQLSRGGGGGGGWGGSNLARAFSYGHSLCAQAEKALTKLCGCAGS